MNLFTSKEDLYNDYVVAGMSTRDIAKKYNTAQTNVRRLMQHYNIDARKSNEKTEYYLNKMHPYWDKLKVQNKKWHTKTCEWCGKEFEIDFNTKKNKFCSSECRKESSRAKRKKYFCEMCGKEFKYEDRIYKRKFCDECLSKHKSESQTDRIKTICGYCHKELLVTPSRFNENTYCYCDVKCMAKHYAEIYTGENSPVWTGGKRHYTGGWFHARDEARKRDNYSCQICGITEQEYKQEMSVHHIKKYKSFDDKFEANKLSNLICLCEPCHKFVHSKSNIDKVYIIE